MNPTTENQHIYDLLKSGIMCRDDLKRADYELLGITQYRDLTPDDLDLLGYTTYSLDNNDIEIRNKKGVLYSKKHETPEQATDHYFKILRSIATKTKR